MRTEREMMDLILSTAREDGRIRAVCLEGSRVNPNAPRDIFQDYDVVYVVKETASFQADNNRQGGSTFASLGASLGRRRIRRRTSITVKIENHDAHLSVFLERDAQKRRSSETLSTLPSSFDEKKSAVRRDQRRRLYCQSAQNRQSAKFSEKRQGFEQISASTARGVEN